MGENNVFNPFEASIGVSGYAVGNEDIGAGHSAELQSLIGGMPAVASYSMPNGRTVTVDDHGNILDVHN